MKLWAKTAVQGAACGLAIGSVLLIGGRLWRPQVGAAQGKEPAVAEVVKARRFEVVDPAGKTRVRLDAGNGGSSGLDLYDAEGKMRVRLRVDPVGTGVLDFWDAGGKSRAFLYLRALDGQPGLSLSDAAGKMRAHLSVSRHVGPSLILCDQAGKMRASMSLLPDGQPILSLHDAVTTRVVLSIMNDWASLSLSDKSGRSGAILGATGLETTETGEVTIRPESSLVLLGRDGKVIWKAP